MHAARDIAIHWNKMLQKAISFALPDPAASILPGFGRRSLCEKPAFHSRFLDPAISMHAFSSRKITAASGDFDG